MCDYKNCKFPVIKKKDDDGKKYCIFHSKRVDKDIDEFIQKFKKVYNSEKHDFEGFVFPREFDFQDFAKDLKNNNLTFINAIFRYCTFFCDIDFSNSTFKGDGITSFNRSEFRGKGNVNFSRAEFESLGRTYFSNARFCNKGKVIFNNTEFRSESGTSFFSTLFSSDVDFLQTYFLKNINFKEARFKGMVRFENNIFNDSVSFIGNIPIERNDFFNSGASFQNVTFLDNERVIFNNIDFSKTIFTDTDLIGVRFGNIKWAESNKKRKVYNELLLKSKYKNEEGKYEDIANIYKQLRYAYESTGRYFDAGDFFFGEMEMRRKGKFENIFVRIVLNLYRHLSSYGESPVRAFLFLVILWLLFGFVYMAIGIEPKISEGNALEYNSIIRNVFSFKSIFTVDFLRDYFHGLIVSLDVITLGRIKYFFGVMNKPVAYLLKGIQLVFSALFLSLFILAMNRKFRRTKD